MNKNKSIQYIILFCILMCSFAFWDAYRYGSYWWHETLQKVIIIAMVVLIWYLIERKNNRDK